jgi:colanic acid/amylovoran biosynthesis glycosyltransferase
MKLCIATYAAPGPSETFIADHIGFIAPKNTVLLCGDSRDTEQFGCPVLQHSEAPPRLRGLVERVINASRRQLQTYFQFGLGLTDRKRVIGFLKLHDTDVVLAEYGPIGCLLACTCRQARVPLFVHFHGYDASILLRDKLQVWQYKLLFRSASGVIVPSQFLARKLTEIGCPNDTLYVNPYGIDTRIFSPVSRVSQQRLIAVGRLVEKKAPQLVIQAFVRIAHRYPEARLDVVGDGPLAALCQDLIVALGLGSRVQMHGVRNRKFVARLMQRGSIFVQHSITALDGDTEGLPVAILEAMASGLPVISTRHAGIPEAVTDGVTGLLVAENDVDAMARAMGELLDEPVRAAAMGAAGRKRALSCFTREMACDRLRAIMGIGSLNKEDPADRRLWPQSKHMA